MTIRSYVSAIKCILEDDQHKFSNELMQLSSLTKACRILNDRIRTRLPIHLSLLQLLIFEVDRLLGTQVYLATLYKAMLAMGYYGLFRVGKLAKGDHSIKAANIHIGVNKNKILVVLYTSKMHGYGSRPQKVKNMCCRQQTHHK